MGPRPLREPSPEEDRAAAAIVHAAYTVHGALGPGLLESVYEACFCHELGKAGFTYTGQKPIPLVYDGLVFDEGFRVDVIVDDKVLCELKSVERLLPVHEAQLLSYLLLREVDERWGR